VDIIHPISEAKDEISLLKKKNLSVFFDRVNICPATVEANGEGLQFLSNNYARLLLPYDKFVDYFQSPRRVEAGGTYLWMERFLISACFYRRHNLSSFNTGYQNSFWTKTFRISSVSIGDVVFRPR
jgi:hypothetical protein